MRTYRLVALLLFPTLPLSFAPGCPSADDDQSDDDQSDDDACDDDVDDDDDTSGGIDYCAYYITCVGEVDPASVGEILETYGDEGSCWDGADYEFCQNACRNGWDQLVEGFQPGPGACFAEGATWFEFDPDDEWEWAPDPSPCYPEPHCDVTITGTPRPELKMSFLMVMNSAELTDTRCAMTGLEFECESYSPSDDSYEYTVSGTFAAGYEELTAVFTMDPGGSSCHVSGNIQ